MEKWQWLKNALVISLHNGVWHRRNKSTVSWPLVYWFTISSTICSCKYMTYAGQARENCLGLHWSVEMSIYTVYISYPGWVNIVDFLKYVDNLDIIVLLTRLTRWILFECWLGRNTDATVNISLHLDSDHSMAQTVKVLLSAEFVSMIRGIHF